MNNCMEISPHGFLCTREPSHGGAYHIAKIDECRDGRQIVVDRWAIEPVTS